MNSAKRLSLSAIIAFVLMSNHAQASLRPCGQAGNHELPERAYDCDNAGRTVSGGTPFLILNDYKAAAGRWILISRDSLGHEVWLDKASSKLWGAPLPMPMIAEDALKACDASLPENGHGTLKFHWTLASETDVKEGIKNTIWSVLPDVTSQERQFWMIGQPKLVYGTWITKPSSRTWGVTKTRVPWRYGYVNPNEQYSVRCVAFIENAWAFSHFGYSPRALGWAVSDPFSDRRP